MHIPHCRVSPDDLILRSRPKVGVSKDAWFETRSFAALLTMRKELGCAGQARGAKDLG